MQTTRIKKIALFLAGIFLLIVAVILNLDQLYLMGAVLILLPGASAALGWAMMRGLACRRAGIPVCREGERFTVTLTVENTGRLPKLYLRVADRLPPSVRLVGDGVPLILQLASGEAVDVSYQAEATRRGAYPLGPVQVTATDPLGLYSHGQIVRAQSELLVYPKVLPLRKMTFSSGGVWGQRETDTASMRGDGLDFHGVRDYQPGDELRRVHWRTTARTGHLAVMEYTHGTSSDALIALDLNQAAYAGMDPGPDGALEFAIRIAAAACDYLLREGYVVRVALPSIEAMLSTPLRHTADMPVLLEALARANADIVETLAETLARALPWVTAGMTVLYITPEAGSTALAGVLTDCAARGAQTCGYLLDKDTFQRTGRGQARDGRPSAMDPAAPRESQGSVIEIQKGDDLMQKMEGGIDARW